MNERDSDDLRTAPKRFRSIESVAVAGLIFAVLSFISLILLTPQPNFSAPDSEIVAWYSEPTNRTSLTVGLTLATVAAISFLWFIAVIRRRVGDREDRFFATVFFGSGILLTGVYLVGAAVLASPAITVDLADGRVPDASVLAALNGLGKGLLLIVLNKVQAVFVISTSTLAFRTNTFSRWLSYTGYGFGLAMFFWPFISEPIGLAFPVWVGILSVALLVRRSELIPDRGGG